MGLTAFDSRKRCVIDFGHTTPEIFTTLDDPISLAFGEFTIGTGINDSRQIVGVYNDHITGGKGFLATPSVVPLPAALPLFASGLAGLAWLARRKRRQALTQAVG